jgi:hypothetical protein
MRRSAAVTIGLAIVLGMTACVGAPGSEVRPTATERPSAATGTPADVAPISDIVILPVEVRLQAGETVRQTIAYDAPIDVALAAFADLLGPQTGSQEYPATNHTQPTTAHRFGDVTIFEPHYGGLVENDPIVRPAWVIRADTAMSGSVHIGTVGGITVGSSVEQIPGWDDPNRMGTSVASTGTMAELLVVAAPGSHFVPTDSAGAYGVLAIASPYPGPITTIVAPSQHGGA